MTLLRSLVVLVIALSHASLSAAGQSPQFAAGPAGSSEGAQSGRQANARSSARSSAAFISGKILVDGRPLGGVRIAISSPGSLSTLFENLMGGGNVEQTEDDGRFTFEGLRSGAYTLKPFLTGYIVESGVQDSDGQQIYYRPGDFASIRMVKGGVITGRVFGESGSPLVGVSVRAICLRDLQGRRYGGLGAESLDAFQPMTTDDRGVYRIYGLQPGIYAVCAGGGGLSLDSTGPFDNDSPVYHPSSSLADAVEVTVRAGQESAGIDIGYRELSGHSISGNLGGSIPGSALVSGAAVMLTEAGTGSLQGLRVGLGLGDATSRVFLFSGVPDGKYELTAVGGLSGNEITVAHGRTVAVQASDVTGVDLTLGPVSEVSGRVVLDTTQTESKPECAKALRPVEQAVISIRKAGQETRQNNLGPFFSRTGEGIPDGKGEFKVRLVSSGVHIIQVNLPGDDLYLRSMSLPQLADGRPARNPAEGLEVKIGEKLLGVTITLARGAASLAGRVVPDNADSKPTETTDFSSQPNKTPVKSPVAQSSIPGPAEVQANKIPKKSPLPNSSNQETSGNSHGISVPAAALPERLEVVLVPAEPESANDPLRYAGSPVQPDGSFAFKQLAPGRYYLLARTIPNDQWNSLDRLPEWYNAEQRKMLHREAKKAGITIELNRCAEVKDHSLRYTAAGKLSKD